MKNKKNRPAGLKYQKKSDCIDIEELKSYLLSNGKRETKDFFADKYNVSAITVHRVMKNAGLVRNYKYKNQIK